ncbi:cation diffusion facilitator CzcD-associated flavoprotein CzcO [Bradyrhizobium diazoefficiens]
MGAVKKVFIVGGGIGGLTVAHAPSADRRIYQSH